MTAARFAAYYSIAMMGIMFGVGIGQDAVSKGRGIPLPVIAITYVVFLVVWGVSSASLDKRTK